MVLRLIQGIGTIKGAKVKSSVSKILKILRSIHLAQNVYILDGGRA